MNRTNVKAIEDIPGLITKGKTYEKIIVTVWTSVLGQPKTSKDYSAFYCDNGKCNVLDDKYFEDEAGN